WVIHMLRRVAGEANFWQALKEYRSRFAYASATTEDLQLVFEDVTGKPLGWFFHQWVYEPNYPYYRFGWHQEKSDGQYKLYAFIEQVQTDAPLFKMPIDLTITTTSSETTFVIMVDNSLEKFNYVSPDSIINFQFDKDDWVLKKVAVITTPIFQYIDHQVIDSTGNNNGIADAGETVDVLIRITNKGIMSRTIKAWLTSSDPSLEIPLTFFSWSLLTVDYDKIKNDLELQLPFSVKPGASVHLATFQLHLEADNNFIAVDSFDVKIGSPTILLVDDDDGANYEKYFTQSMSLSKSYSDAWEVSAQGIPAFADVLQNYRTVIWFTGDDRTTSLTRDEQNVLAEFLDHGGNLVLTGQNIGYDLIVDGTPEDSIFFKKYLHADFLADTVKSAKMLGVSGDPIGSGMFVYIDEKAGGARNQQSPDAISPRDGAVTFLKYIPQMSSAAIRYVDGIKNYKLVYLGFGIEGISGPYQDTAQKLLEKILNWFSSSTDVENIKLKALPEQYELEQNYPNPFNPSTTIRYHLPQPGHVTITIYNMRGQEIKTLINNTQNRGSYEFIWDGTNDAGTCVASGIFMYRLKTKSFTSTKKLALIK
ncbi:MAG TPA: FlgD immunoglobulin-like domain containing protein, partial [bacterium]